MEVMLVLNVTVFGMKIMVDFGGVIQGVAAAKILIVMLSVLSIL